MTDWKARCAELVDAIGSLVGGVHCGHYQQRDMWKCREIFNRIRAELDQPEPKGLTRQEAQELFNSIRVPIIERLTPGGDEEIVGYEPVQPVDFAHAVLARCCGCSTNNDPPQRHRPLPRHRLRRGRRLLLA